MQFKINFIENKEQWEKFLLEIQEKTFLQSWYFGEFQEKLNNKVWHLGIYDNDILIAISQILKIEAKRGKFILLQHGPIIKENYLKNKFEIINLFVEKIKEIAKIERCSFFRIVPYLENTKENNEFFEKLNFKIAPLHANAYEATLKINLLKTEDELLKSFRKTTRYLILKNSKNKDIKIEEKNNLQSLDAYLKLNKEVSLKKGFIPFSDEFIKKEFEVFAKNGLSSIFLGKYKDEIVCGALIIFWSNIAFYHQAASSFKYQNLSIPYLLLWEAIKEAKKRNCVLFDLWGYVDPEKYPNHPWAGPTLFKLGFTKNKKEYLKTRDLILSPKYYITFLIEKIKKIKKGI